MEVTERHLSEGGLRVDALASTKLVLDFPPAYGLSVLEELQNDCLRLILVTWNPCKEHLEDLWDLGPSALLAGEFLEKQDLVRTLVEIVDRVSNGERYRLTQGPSTVLTYRERTALRYVAKGWDNRHIAQQMHVKEQTVKNTLRSVYRKLEICDHVEAALYYWGHP